MINQMKQNDCPTLKLYYTTNLTTVITNNTCNYPSLYIS